MPAKPTPGSRRSRRLGRPRRRGDPESPLRWTIKSTRQLASALADGGRPVAPNTVRSLLYRFGLSLHSNAKVAEGAQHPDRNAQFGYINEQVRRHLRRGEPVVSVDHKKKELIGNYKNAGEEWRKAKSPRAVNTYDFVDKEAGGHPLWCLRHQAQPGLLPRSLPLPSEVARNPAAWPPVQSISRRLSPPRR